MEVRYAAGTASVTLPNGTQVLVTHGSHWPADDPVVQAQPTLFSTDPRYGLSYSTEPAGYGDPVEAATAVPGERRSARRS